MIPKAVITFLYLLDLLQYSFFFLLHRIGLNPNFDPEATPWENEDVLFSSVGIPVPTSTSIAESLKCKLPVMEFQRFIQKKGKFCTNEAKEECVICLRYIEAEDHVRELGNCCHAFHVDCMDRWLNLGRFCCPLCRSAVAPAEAGLRAPLSVLKVLLVGRRPQFKRC
ncbi:E3 ubiquitin-protein ligase ATL4-like [Phalaenopsis equestris]|uniref:E3 ubiquitin-protein ligase ATL4-like n=1 Tax=Phalaenopsis equestris TaxID=78828 RepID=UPI0009E5CC3B|nr:E3 ubiquitin-protein ligase ATL4-like [Phalaenopsis equestris]XP_020595852.1 E3 ubiquitin-protein ligase ATL4-like [Phalaenopsis equestris]